MFIYLTIFQIGIKFSQKLMQANSTFFSSHQNSLHITRPKESSNESNETDESVDSESLHDSVFTKYAETRNLSSFSFSPTILHPEFLKNNDKSHPIIECFFDNKTMYTDLSNFNSTNLSKNYILELIDKAEEKNVEILVISISKLSSDYKNLVRSLKIVGFETISEAKSEIIIENRDIELLEYEITGEDDYVDMDNM